MRRIDYIVIHCTAGAATETTADLLKFFRNVRKWKNPGYHIVVNADGTADRLTPDEQIANGVQGHNANSIHLCYKGAWNGTDTRTPEQKATLLKLVKEYKAKYPGAKVLGHRDLSPDLNGDGIITPNEYVKLCPCFNAPEEYKNL